jgi:hypothetical protein
LVQKLGAYVTPDGYRHAIVGTETGRLKEVYYSATGSGLSQIACFDYFLSVDAFYTPDDGYQHPIVATRDGVVHEIFYKPGDLNYGGPLGTFPGGIDDVSGFYTPDDQHRHVVVSSAGQLTDIDYSAQTETVLGSLSSPVTGVSAFYSPDDGFRHAVVATADGLLTEVYYHSTGVYKSKLGVGPYTAGIIDIAAFYTPNGFRNVIVGTADGRVINVYYTPSAGVRSEHLTTLGSTILGVGAFYTSDHGFNHVLVSTLDGTVTEIFFSSTIGVHVASPPVARFGLPTPTLDDASPDVTNVSATTLAAAESGGSSPAGRVAALAGVVGTLYALTWESGVWRFSGGRWRQVPTVPSNAHEAFNANALSKLAIDPANAAHAVVGGIDGAWETHNAGARWLPVNYNATHHGAQTKDITAVAFAPDGGLLLGSSVGIARRPPGSSSFTQRLRSSVISAFAVGQRVGVNAPTVWARSTDGTLWHSSDFGASFSGPIAPDPSYPPVQACDLAALDVQRARGPGAYAYFLSGMGVSGFGGVVPTLAIYNLRAASWAAHPVSVTGEPLFGLGTGLGGQQVAFVKAFNMQGSLPAEIGQGIQMFVSAGQDFLVATGQGPNGTVSGWEFIARTQESGTGGDQHPDFHDIAVDTRSGATKMWIAGDGGVAQGDRGNTYVAGTNQWTLLTHGLHAQNLGSVTIMPQNPVYRSNVVYPTSDNNAWVRPTATVVAIPAPWEAFDGFGDCAYSFADAGHPQYALVVRHNAACRIRDFSYAETANPGDFQIFESASPNGVNYGSPWFSFIQSPKGQAVANLHAVVAVPYVRPFDVSQTFPDPPPNGLMLVRSDDFVQYHSMSGDGNAHWRFVAKLPHNAGGFYVTGSPSAPIYYSWAPEFSGAGSFGLFKLTTTQFGLPVWTKLIGGLVANGSQFGPAFVNPYNSKVIYVTSASAIQVSTNGGASFVRDKSLTALVTRNGAQPTKSLVHMAFLYDNPARVAAITSSGGLFVKSTFTGWHDLSGVLPKPSTPLVAVGIDCESVYVATDGRSLPRVLEYSVG